MTASVTLVVVCRALPSANQLAVPCVGLGGPERTQGRPVSRSATPHR